MFKILGADGKEYGPVTGAQLRQWIHEGRAGGQTQVRVEGAADWTRLRELPELGDVFATPALNAAGTTGLVPTIIRTLAIAMFVVTAISALILLATILSNLRFRSASAPNLDFTYYLHCGVGALSLPARLIAAIGLLRGREWARRLAVGLAIALTLYGGWGLVRMVVWWTSHPEVLPSLVMSPLYLGSTFWSLVVFLFNLATIVLLCRPDVRAAFAPKSSTGV